MTYIEPINTPNGAEMYDGAELMLCIDYGDYAEPVTMTEAQAIDTVNKGIDGAKDWYYTVYQHRKTGGVDAVLDLRCKDTAHIIYHALHKYYSNPPATVGGASDVPH